MSSVTLTAGTVIPFSGLCHQLDGGREPTITYVEKTKTQRRHVPITGVPLCIVKYTVCIGNNCFCHFKFWIKWSNLQIIWRGLTSANVTYTFMPLDKGLLAHIVKQTSGVFSHSREHYVTSVAWQDDSHILITWSNRVQNHSIIMLCSAKSADCYQVMHLEKPFLCTVCASQATWGEKPQPTWLPHSRNHFCA